MNILVTGGAGFIGSNFIRYLLNITDEHFIVNLDKLTYSGNLENLTDVEKGFSERYKFIKDDICNRETVRYIIKNYQIEAIINFAAETHVDRSIKEGSKLFIRTNILGTETLLSEGLSGDIRLYIQISTDEVYGSLGEEGIFTEKSVLSPTNPYSASKAGADLLALSYFRTFRFPVVIVRSCNNFGPYQFPEKLIPLLITNAIEDKYLPIYGEGRNVREWIFVEDFCRAVYMIMNKSKLGEVYNISTGFQKRNIEVAELILKKFSKGKDLIKFVEDRKGHDWRYSMDFSKVRNEIGWSPGMDFERGLVNTIKWYSENSRWVKNVKSGEYLKYYEKYYGLGGVKSSMKNEDKI